VALVMRCIVSLVTVALGMAAMTMVVAMPALAAKPAPAKEECREALVALVRGENPRGNRNTHSPVWKLPRVYSGKLRVKKRFKAKG
jgi:hypothetical protein